MNFSNSKPLKMAAVVLAIMSVILIIGAVITHVQSLRKKSSTVSTNSASLLPPPSFSLPPVSSGESQNISAESAGVTLQNLPVVELPPFTVKWLSEPKKITYSTLQDGQYYKMGSTSRGEDVIYRIGSEGMAEQTLGRWIKMLNGDFVLLEKQSSFSEESQFFDEVVIGMGRLVRDEQSEIPGVSIPDSFEYAGMNWKQEGQPQYITPLDTISEEPNYNLASLSFGDLFSKEKRNEELPSFGSVNYFVRIADRFYFQYTLDNGKADDGTLIASWKAGYGSLGKMLFNAGIKNGGCGFVGDNRYYPKKGEVEKYEKVGDLKFGSALYLMTGSNNGLVDYLFKDVQYGAKPDTSREEFVKHLTVLLSPDPLGRGYLFYYSIDDPELMLMAECAKPVIYLYPEKTTDVSVKVGAHITKSEPEYESGWKVTAEPNGTLRDGNGKVWDSLFWDGTGLGEYPTIREGKVVPRSEIQKVLKSDLMALGLNEYESADFLEFWLPHMPETPYVRLTWLTTNEMNRLAPLAVSPRPQTTIRVFLDFSGQETSLTNLTPQALTAIPRKGFTLIEWGGLLWSTKPRP